MNELQNKTYIPQSERKTILFLADDMRMNSGIATMARNIVLGSVHKYNWVQIAAAVKHPEKGKALDLSGDVNKQTGLTDASVVLYPVDGYGDQNLVRKLMMTQNIGAILHFTDPRFWIWLYQMEHEIREHIPIFFYHIWDDLPYPMYNRNYYESCDWIGCISKQTYGIVHNVWGSHAKTSWKQPDPWQIDYIPHGIDENVYKPLDTIGKSTELEKIKKKLFKDKQYDFIVFWNNRNIRRKQTGDVIQAFAEFTDRLPKEEADKCVLLMHTAPVDQNGTDLPKVVEAVAPNSNVVFTNSRVSQDELNYYYNIADVTVNIASNEGWGLSSTESMMAGTMVINNVTGGLQDQLGFKFKGKFLTADDYSSTALGTLHDRRKWKDNKDLTFGEWGIPIWPSSINLVGSVPTPYIYDDRCSITEVSEAMELIYKLEPEERDRRGQTGRDFALTDGNMKLSDMAGGFITGMDTAFTNFKNRKRFELIEV